MARIKYMGLKLIDLPKSVVQHYNIENNSTRDGYLYVEIKRGMYGILQAGFIVQQLLDKKLNKKGYHQIEITTRFWTHNWRPLLFSLCFDDFGV